MRKVDWIVAAVLGGALATATSAQQATHGVAGFYGGDAQDFSGDTQFPAGDRNTTFTGSLPFSVSASGSRGPASADVAASATPSNGNIGLHGRTAASLNGAMYETAGAFSALDLYAFDTFHIGGAAGTPQQFQYSLNLDALASTTMSVGNANATRAYGYLELFGDSNWVTYGSISPFVPCANGVEANGNPCGEIAQLSDDAGGIYPQSQTVTGVINLTGGSTIELGEALILRSYVSQETTGSATFDASNTGFFTLLPITPGASFTTDSGLGYANSPDLPEGVPEPATWAMMLLGFGAMSLVVRPHRSAVHK